MKRKLFSISLVLVVLASSWLVLHAMAQEPAEGENPNPEVQGTGVTSHDTSAEPGRQSDGGGEIQSLGGSKVTFDPSVGGSTAYIPGADQTFCFRAETFTTDFAYVYNLWERFPADVTVSNVYVQGTPTCTGGGTWGTFAWSFQTAPYEVNINHRRYQQTTDHCTAYYCFDVTSGSGPGASISWYWDGDGFGSPPHNPCSSDGYTPAGQNPCDQQVNPQAVIPPAHIDLSPAFQVDDSCACEWQDHTLTATNFTDADASFILSYTLEGPGLIQGPPVTGIITDTGSREVEVQAKLDGCILPGTTITATVHALEPASGYTATATIVKHSKEQIYDPAGWVSMPVTNTTGTYWQACAVGTNPAAAGEVGYQIGGLSITQTIHAYSQMYDPNLAAWTELAAQPRNVHSAVAGWLDGRLFVASGFEDNSFHATPDLQVYSPATNSWNNTSYPDLPAAGGRGGASGGVGTCHTGTGNCLFLVGGAPSGTFSATTLDTWEYDPSFSTWTQLDPRPQGSSPSGAFMGGGVGCLGFIFQGGDYRGYHDFYRLDAAQAAGSRWEQMASIPPEGGAMNPSMVCVEEDQAIYLIGGAPNGYWGNYNTSVYRYDIPSDTWNGPMAAHLNTGVLGSCGLNMTDRLWSFGGTQGSGALYPPPHESLPKIPCPACTGFDAIKAAPPTAETGQVITYTIIIDTASIQPGMTLSDPLPAGVDYAGGLTASMGTAWYESPPANTVFWNMPYGLEIASPHPPYASPPGIAFPEAAAEEVGAEAESTMPAAAPVRPYSPQEVLYDNGPLVTHPGGGAGGADASALQNSLGMNLYAFGHQFYVGNRVADDFTVSNPLGWQVDRITFFAYQTNAPASPSPIAGVYYQIWDGPPNDPGSSVVFGDLTTNRLINTTWSNIYRVRNDGLVNTSRPIYADTTSAGVILPPGTYWIDWMTDGNPSYSGPWAPPISILGQTTTGNALQYTGGWNPAMDTGTNTQQGIPFIIQGTPLAPIEITFNASVTAPAFDNVHNQGVATCGTHAEPFFADTRVVGTPDIAGSVPLPPISVELWPGASHTTGLAICNEGNAALSWGFGELPLEGLISNWTSSRIETSPPVDLPGPMVELQASAQSQASTSPAPLRPEAVLWDQPTNNFTSIIDQYFADFGRGVFNADDFIITHTWVITGIYVEGEWGDLTHADDLHWCFYPDVGGKPFGYPLGGGEIGCLTLLPSHPGLTFFDSSTGVNTSVAVNLAEVTGGLLRLPPGHYWMSFYPSLNFSLYKQWFWDTSGTTYGQIAQVIDPTNLFSRGWQNWTPWTVINPDNHDAAFRLEGMALDTPWLSEGPDNSVTGPGGCNSIGVTLDSDGLPPGVYNAGLFLVSNDPEEAYLYTPVTMTVKTITYGATLVPPSTAQKGDPGETVSYILDLTNTGNYTNTFTLSAAGNTWEVSLPVPVVSLAGGESLEITVNVTIPSGASGGDSDSATITATGSGGASDSSVLTTSVEFWKTYLPLAKKP